jgi:hypothetical protein
MKALTVSIMRVATIATLPCTLIVGQVIAADLSTREVTETLFKSKRGAPIDFSGKDLSFLDLSGLDFKGAKLASVNLYGALTFPAQILSAPACWGRLLILTLQSTRGTRPVSSGPTCANFALPVVSTAVSSVVRT